MFINTAYRPSRWCGMKDILQGILHFMLPRTGSSSQGMVFIISLQRWLMWFDIDKHLVKRAHLLEYGPATLTFEAPHWVPKVSTVGDHSTAHRYTGVFNQPLELGLTSWVLAG